MVVHDGHVHSPFCPHGSPDQLEQYVEKGIELGLKGLTFTEHAPLPKHFVDPVPTQDSAMSWEDLPLYFEEVQNLKKKYRNRFDIKLGLEVDYIEGYEEEITELLNDLGSSLDDAILSVHFLKKGADYYCIDYSPEEFERISLVFGGVDAVHAEYYRTVKKSIKCELGPFKPKRIGHMTLANKFQKKFPPTNSFWEEQIHVLDLMKAKGYQLDYNSAGLSKPLCRETYPSADIIKIAASKQIPIVYGSDAHSSKALLLGSDQINKDVLL